MRSDDSRRGEHLVEKFTDVVSGEEVSHESVWQRENPAQTENVSARSVDHETASARVASRFKSIWLRKYVASKLRTDPIFPAAYTLFSASSSLPILDVGCGVGLLGFYLRERSCDQQIVGIDTDGRKIRQALEISEGNYRNLDFVEQDARNEMPSISGNVALIDVLHYLPPAAQSILLARCAERVARGGIAVIRDCPRDGGLRFRLTHLAERFAQIISWNLNAALHFPTRESVSALFPEAEFSAEVKPLWGGTPFNNHLFVFRRTSTATDSASGR